MSKEISTRTKEVKQHDWTTDHRGPVVQDEFGAKAGPNHSNLMGHGQDLRFYPLRDSESP